MIMMENSMDNENKKIKRDNKKNDFSENQEVNKVKLKANEVKTNKKMFDRMMESNERNKKYFGL